MHLYTVLLDYAGGTYTSQVNAADEGYALRQWVQDLSDRSLAGQISNEVAAAFVSMSDRPVEIEGLVSIWCASASAKQGLALANIVRTAT